MTTREGRSVGHTFASVHGIWSFIQADSEKDLKTECDRETKEMEARGMDTDNSTVEQGMTEEEKRQLAIRKAKEEARKAERLEKARLKELAKKQKKEEREENARHAKLVR